MSRRSSKKSHRKERTATRPRLRLSKRQIAVSAAGLLILVIAGFVFADWWSCLPEDTHATYVGSDSCIECHQDYYEQWQGSHHDLAMDHATPATVLADFDNATLEHFGITSRMFRRDGKFYVNTEGPDGEMADFEVKFVFGYTPLQQYMVEFDRPADMPANEIARLQVLRLTWNTETGEWFYLSPPDVKEKLAPDDELHWTGIAQRWNNMCADCHSTNLQRNFDPQSKIYHTTYSEIDVSCESCHGPGSVHVDLANSRSLFWDRKQGYGLEGLKDDPETQIQTCAPCHSRRGLAAPGFLPGDNYYDYFRNELLSQETYHADGQILDEVYVFASFIQSKMYHNSIRCSDCHDPHAVRLKYKGNAVCTSCHQHPAGKYDTPSHHFHQPGSTGSLCVECHMPQTTYMDVDPRRDHSLRIPRPDVSIDLGTPNACTRCHINKQQAGFSDRDDLTQYLDWILAARNGDNAVKAELARVDQEMEAACREWYGQKTAAERRRKHFAYALDAARKGEPEAAEQLAEVIADGRLPAIVRATALQELGRYDSRQRIPPSLSALEDVSPQVRIAAIANLQGLEDPRLVVKRLTELLSDPVRTVRTEAAMVLTMIAAQQPQGTPRDNLGQMLRGTDRQRLWEALDEYETGQLMSNDRAASHMNLGMLHEALGEYQEAVQDYQLAIHVEPRPAGPRTNLAAVYDRLAEAAEQRVRQFAVMRNSTAGQQAATEAANYRRKAQVCRREELDRLERDARLLPNAATVQYRYGMLLYLHGRRDDAEQALRKAVELEPNTPDFLYGLAVYYLEVGKLDEAKACSRQLLELRPDDPMFRQLQRDLATRPAGP